MRRKEESPGELPTNSGLRNEKYHQEGNYRSQQPRRLSTKEVEENEGNSLQEVCDVSAFLKQICKLRYKFSLTFFNLCKLEFFSSTLNCSSRD